MISAQVEKFKHGHHQNNKIKNVSGKIEKKSNGEMEASAYLMACRSELVDDKSTQQV